MQSLSKVKSDTESGKVPEPEAKISTEAEVDAESELVENLRTSVDPEPQFKEKIKAILKRLHELPDVAEELKLPEVKSDIASVYVKLCGALKEPVSSTFLNCIDGEEIDFSYHCLGPVGIIAVTKASVPSRTIKRLNFSFNKLGAQCLPAITNLLNQNENVAHLNLSNNEIGKNSTRQLGDLISVCHSVEFLDLSGNGLGDEELIEIGACLMKIDSIKELNLSNNDISAVSGGTFGVSIGKCSALERLDLSSNHFEEGAAAIFISLKNSNLKYLNFSKNGIPDEAMEPLRIGVRNSKSLQELDVSSNYITKKGIPALASGLKGSSTLEILRLANNPLEGNAANTVLSSAGSNLKIIDMTGIKVNLAFMKTLRRKGDSIKILFGSGTRYDCFPRDHRLPEDNTVNDSNALEIAQKLADEKGVSLKNVLKNIHGAFITQKAEEALEKSAEEVKSENKGLRHMTKADFAKALSGSPMAVSRSLAQELANSLCDEEGLVNLWEIIPKLKWRPDDIALKIKSKKKPEKDKKGKKNEKGKKK